MNQRYDYIITGGGLAGLSLIHHLLACSLSDKKILLIDQVRKEANDRTWCFWETEAGPFDSIVCQSWKRIGFFSDHFGAELDISPFTYKMIRGIDFYRLMQQEIEEAPNVSVHFGRVEALTQNPQGVRVVVEGGETFEADWVFNSIFFGKVDKSACNYVDQHFKGWVIRTPEAVFDPNVATFMDFRIPQEGEARFFYVLPTGKDTALVELAIFSNDIWPEERYDAAIRAYVRERITQGSYEIVHEEIGVIPMTDFPFPGEDGRILHIGTAGGHTKASTGYTFWRLQEYLHAVVTHLEWTGSPMLKKRFFPYRYSLFDSTLLNVLLHNRVPSDKVFSALFKKNPPQRVLKFLNERTTWQEDLHIMNSVPLPPFILAFTQEAVKKMLKAFK